MKQFLCNIAQCPFATQEDFNLRNKIRWKFKITKIIFSASFESIKKILIAIFFKSIFFIRWTSKSFEFNFSRSKPYIWIDASALSETRLKTEAEWHRKWTIWLSMLRSHIYSHIFVVFFSFLPHSITILSLNTRFSLKRRLNSRKKKFAASAIYQ